MCHYRHRTHDNPLILPGLQDITAHVNFSQVMYAAEQAGFQSVDFQTQADFLIENGILNYGQHNYKSNSDHILAYQTAQALKYLLLPSEMGELFKCITFYSQAYCP